MGKGRGSVKALQQTASPSGSLSKKKGGDMAKIPK